MEGTKLGLGLPLAVRREFVGSRMEPQVLMRAYELVVPTIRRYIVPVVHANVKTRMVRCAKGEPRSQLIAKGA
jgi:hypothetical protein